jgi:DNA-binding transcriptional ArsR family regulator
MSSASKSTSSGKRQLEDYDAVFAAVDSAVRRQILLILHFRGDQMTSGEIAARFSCAWPTTSRHLRKLESAGLVHVERAGREWIYRLNRARLALVGEWLEWFARPPREVTTATRVTRRRGVAGSAKRGGVV